MAAFLGYPNVTGAWKRNRSIQSNRWGNFHIKPAFPICDLTMLDPATAIGLVASVDQLTALAKTIVSNLYQYFNAVQKAPKRSLELRNEMGVICGLLEKLQVLTNEPSFPSSAPLKDAIPSLQTILAEMNTRIAERQTKGLRKLKWPFSEEENNRLLSRISHYIGTFNMALNLRNSYCL